MKGSALIFQTTCANNFGGSGGGVFNKDGELIAVFFGMYDNKNMNIATSALTVEKWLKSNNLSYLLE